MKEIEKYFPFILLAFVVLLFKPIWRLIQSITAIIPEVNTAQGDNFKNTVVAIERSAGVKSQMTALNASKADQLYKAMDKVGTDKGAIRSILYAKDFGPNQLGAIYSYYGIRELHAFGFPVLKGDLLVHLRDEMGSEFDKELSPYLDKLFKMIK